MYWNGFPSFMKLSPSITKEGLAIMQARNNAKKTNFIFLEHSSQIKLVFIDKNLKFKLLVYNFKSMLL